MSKRQIYSSEFKQKAIQETLKNKNGVKAAAAAFNVPDKTLYRWLAEYKALERGETLDKKKNKRKGFKKACVMLKISRFEELKRILENKRLTISDFFNSKIDELLIENQEA